MAAGIEVAALLSGIWAASLAVFSQDLSAPDAAVRCAVELVGVGCLPPQIGECSKAVAASSKFCPP